MVKSTLAAWAVMPANPKASGTSMRFADADLNALEVIIGGIDTGNLEKVTSNFRWTRIAPQRRGDQPERHGSEVGGKRLEVGDKLVLVLLIVFD